MDLYQLGYFVVLAEELNFSRAAARCNMSQQALSRAVAKLERQIGLQLVERTARGCSLTDAGRALVPEARDLLSRADDLRRAVTRTDRQEKDFVVGVHDEGLAELTPLVCAAFRARHPEVRLVLRTLPYSELPDAVRHRRVDALFCLADAVADRAGFTAVYDESAVLVVGNTDAFAGASSVHGDDVLDRKFAAKGRVPDHFYAPYALGSLRNGEPVREIDLPSPDSLPDLTRHIVDHGAVIVASASVARIVSSPSVTSIPLVGSPAFTNGVVSGRTHPELQQSLVELAISMARTDLDVVPTARLASTS